MFAFSEGLPYNDTCKIGKEYAMPSGPCQLQVKQPSLRRKIRMKNKLCAVLLALALAAGIGLQQAKGKPLPAADKGED